MPPAGRAFDLGQRKRGEIVEVTLRGSAANVLLVDSTNKRNYEAAASGEAVTCLMGPQVGPDKRRFRSMTIDMARATDECRRKATRHLRFSPG